MTLKWDFRIHCELALLDISRSNGALPKHEAGIFRLVPLLEDSMHAGGQWGAIEVDTTLLQRKILIVFGIHGF